VILVFAHLLVKVLDQEKTKSPFRSSSPVTCHYQHLTIQGRGIPSSALSKDTTANLPACSPHYPFNTERKAEKL